MFRDMAGAVTGCLPHDPQDRASLDEVSLPHEQAEAAFATGDEADPRHPGLTGGPLAAAPVTWAIQITESDGNGGRESEDVLAVPGLTGEVGLPEPEAVPF